jgi:hypothetical protein
LDANFYDTNHHLIAQVYNFATKNYIPLSSHFLHYQPYIHINWNIRQYIAGLDLLMDLLMERLKKKMIMANLIFSLFVFLLNLWKLLQFMQHIWL